jgi:hypothetical protein
MLITTAWKLSQFFGEPIKKLWVAERRAAENERELAEVVAEAMGENTKWTL